MTSHVRDPALRPPSPAAPPVSWAAAARATLHCLAGCAIGELLGMVIGSAAGLDSVTTVILSIALAVAFVLTTPVSRVMIRAGRGHAVLHQFRHASR